jgi:deferrochelatase/peroxidase EfeB
MNAPLWPLDKIQGFLLRGYRMSFSRHFALSVRHPAAARTFIAGLVGKDEKYPQITSAEPWGERKASYCVNIGFTYPGLQKLGVPQSSLDSFNTVDGNPFVVGSAARAPIVGDVGASAPTNWVVSDRDFDVLLTLFTLTTDDLAALTKQVSDLFAAGFDAPDPATRIFDGQVLEDGKVYFGYSDGIAQPIIENNPFSREPDGDQDLVDPGAFMFGTALRPYYKSVIPPTPDTLGTYGCFGAFRILRQDVDGFEKQIETLAPDFGKAFGITDPDLQKQALKAKICGRWPNGTPLELFPIQGDSPPPALPPEQINNFKYTDDGLACPIGAHLRRGNPRNTGLTGSNPLAGQPTAEHRILRRNLPYQIPYDPDNRDTGERGLVGWFLGTSFIEQFEFLLANWINASFFTAIDPADPLVGTNPAGGPYFETVPTGPNKPGSRNKVRPINSFIFTKGSAYCYYPGIDGVRWIAQQG